MKRLHTAVVLGLVMAICFGSQGEFAGRLHTLQHSVLRLHILADSDTQEDQDLKYKVRDALLEASGELFDGCTTLPEMQERALEQLDTIEALAQEVLRENGCTDNVTAEVTEMEFPVKQYEKLTMPAGTYSALRILIGEAQGQNWWCVMYPPLCLPAGTETPEGWFDAETADMLENPQQYEIKFKCVEWIQQIREKCGDKKSSPIGVETRSPQSGT